MQQLCGSSTILPRNESDAQHVSIGPRSAAVVTDANRTAPLEQAVWKSGMYVNQNTATKLRNQYTITEVSAAFQLDQGM